MYQFAAKLAILADNGKGYKNALYSSKNKKNIKSVYFLLTNAVKKKEVIDKLLSHVGLLEKTNAEMWLARVLVTELLWGRGHLPFIGPLSKVITEHKNRLVSALSKFDKETPQDDEPIPRYIRINNEVFTKESAISFLEDKGFIEAACPGEYEEFLSSIKSLKINQFVFDFHIPNLIVFNRKTKLDELSSVSFIRQDKSSCLVSLLLAPLPGSNILDMCAAPGYKTQHASSLIHKMGKIYSVDINRERYKTLESTCRDFKLEGCVSTLNMDTLKTTDVLCPSIEYLIVDPPCSGTGIANLLVRHKADENRLRKLSNLQAMILKHALKGFPLGRRLVYSTCSEEEAENEGVVRECLYTATANGWRLVPLTRAFRGSFSSGIDNLGLRLSPGHDLTNGFYLALFERSVPPASGTSIQDSTSSLEVLTDPCELNNNISPPVTKDLNSIESKKQCAYRNPSEVMCKKNLLENVKTVNRLSPKNKAAHKVPSTSAAKINCKIVKRVRSKKLKINKFHVRNM